MRGSELSIGKSGNPVDPWARAKPQRGHWMIGYHSHPRVDAAAKAAMESGFPTPSAPSRPDGSEESAYGRLRAIRVQGYP